MDEDEAVWLAERLKNGPAWVRKSHVEALGKSGDLRAVAPLCAALKDPEIGDAAAQMLVRLGRAAVPALCKALKEPDPAARRRTAEVLGRVGDPRAVPPLIDLLQHPDWRSRRPAALALEGIGPPAIPFLCTALSSASGHVRCEAAAILGKIGDESAIPSLCAAIRQGQPEAAAALGEIAMRSPVPELRSALPLLREQARYDMSTFEGYTYEEYQKLLVALKALWRIAAVTAEAQRLPIPAAAPRPSTDSLPAPSSPAEMTAECLPIPVAAGADSVAADRRVVNGPAVNRRALAGWWQRLLQGLSGRR